jgi:hypothetical protein
LNGPGILNNKSAPVGRIKKVNVASLEDSDQEHAGDETADVRAPGDTARRAPSSPPLSG